MRRLRLDREAETDLARQLDYLADQGAFEAAEKLRLRVQQFLTDQLCPRPERRHIPECDICEVWIPDTKLVVWYRFTDEELEVVRFWHTSQDREQTP